MSKFEVAYRAINNHRMVDVIEANSASDAIEGIKAAAGMLVVVEYAHEVEPAPVKRKAALTFANIPAWTLPDAPHARALWEVIALAGLEGQWIRLDAGTQRALMGHPVFGKQSLCVNADGTVTVARSVCFGTMAETCTYEPAEVSGAASNGKRLSPGVSYL